MQWALRCSQTKLDWLFLCFPHFKLISEISFFNHFCTTRVVHTKPARTWILWRKFRRELGNPFANKNYGRIPFFSRLIFTIVRARQHFSHCRHSTFSSLILKVFNYGKILFCNKYLIFHLVCRCRCMMISFKQSW